MKKLLLGALALALVVAFTVPAMAAGGGATSATSIDFAGQYRARGYYMYNESLQSDCKSNSNAWYDQRFRLATTFTVHENLKLRTRFDALDNVVWGTTDIYSGYKGYSPNHSDQRNGINFDRAFIDATFPWFNLQVGRMGGGVWATKFVDYSYSVERIKLSTKLGNFIVGGIIQKLDENDGGPTSAATAYCDNWDEDDCFDPVTGDYCPSCCSKSPVDQDRDVYYLYGVYKGEGWDAGLLVPHDRQRQSGSVNLTETAFAPYFRGTFGPIRFETEGWYITGKVQRDGLKDYDTKSWAFYAKGGFDWGPVAFDLAYAGTSGQSGTDEDDDRKAFVRAGGRDFQPLLILTGYYMDANLGCYGNLNMKNAGGNPTGYDLFFGEIGWSPWENFRLNTVIGYAKARETNFVEFLQGEWIDGNYVTPNIDDTFGWEWDVGFKWQLMDNLLYDMKGGIFFADDFYKLGCNNKDAKNEYSVLHALTLTF
jgi:hypothetical protein